MTDHASGSRGAPLLLALDSGTSVVKAVAFDATGEQIAARARPNRVRHRADGGVEQDMAQSWTDAVAVLAELVAALPPGREIAALAVTGQGDGTWLADADGAPVAPAWLWLDARAASLVAALRETEGARRAFAHTGSGLNACQQSSQLLWLARHQPEILARSATAFHCKDWLYFNLTGMRAADPSEACFTFGDWRTRAYAEAVLEALALTACRRLLPPIVDGTRQWHGLAPAAARAIGLPAGLPVVLGYVDVVCTALGGGLYGAGEAGVSILGSTGMHLRLAMRPADVRPNPAMTGYCMVFPVPGAVMQAESNMAATLNIDWLARLVGEAAALAGAPPPDLPARLGEAAAAARPGAMLFHPFISTAGERGPFTDPAARATLFGFDQRAGIAELARAVFEGLGFAARDCYAAMGDLPPEIRITGGAAKSPLMRAILAACLARPVRVIAQPEAGAAGAAMIAALSVGLYPSLDACAARWITPRLGRSEPADGELASLYARLYPLYRDAYRALQPTWQRLATLREGKTDA
jgi:erythritol kinase